MNWKSTAAVSGITLVATWFGWTPSRQFPATSPADVRGPESPAPIDIQEQAARLQSRVRRELDYQNPTRNPFRFTPRQAAPTRSLDRLEPAAASSPTQVPESLPFVLSGMATDQIDGELQRTAILTTASDVLFVKQGDRVGTYTVTRIDERGLDVAGDDGTERRLALIP